jgi:hypothetical protein
VGEDRTDLAHGHIADQRLEVLAIGRLCAGLTEVAIEDPDLLRAPAQTQQHTSSDRTPLARMLPRVIGSPGGDRGRVPMPVRIPWLLSAKAAVAADMF